VTSNYFEVRGKLRLDERALEGARSSSGAA
jgi:hypothetical protein